MENLIRLVAVCVGLIVIAACASPPAPLAVSDVNLDTETQTMIAQAQHVVFVVPFSHWDTDWHDTFDNYVKRADEAGVCQ